MYMKAFYWLNPLVATEGGGGSSRYTVQYTTLIFWNKNKNINLFLLTFFNELG